MRTKAISAVIATIMLLMVTVALIGAFYVFSSTLTGSTTSSGSEQATQLTSQLSSCMQIENIINNQISLRNCGKGVIDNKSLAVTIDEIKLDSNASTIQEGSSGTIKLTGFWQIQPGKHNLKISNGAAVAQSLVDVSPNPDGLVGSWSFDEGVGTIAYDTSGSRNTGIIIDNEGDQWTSGKFGKGLQFDGVNDYTNAGKGTSLMVTNQAFGAWIYRKSDSGNSEIIAALSSATDYDWDIAITNTDNLVASFKDAGGTIRTIQGARTISLNTWYHVAYAWNGTHSLLYLNGVSDATPIDYSSTPPRAPNKELWAGRVQNIYNFNGIIDEMRMWNKTFTPDGTVVIKQAI